jgi:hypothetical protein
VYGSRMRNPRFVLHVTFVLAPLLVACGGGDDGGDDGADVDAPPAAQMLTVTGQAQTVMGTSTVGLEGATIEAYRVGNDSTPLATTTSGANGDYSLMLTTDGTAINGYLKGTSATRLDTYLYPPKPLSGDRMNATVLLVTESTLGLLGTLGGVTQDDTKGFIGVRILDASGAGVPGVTVTINPMGTARIIYAVNNLPNQNATMTDSSATVFIANTNVGEIMVDASGGGVDYYEHPVNARAGVITTTAMEPK